MQFLSWLVEVAERSSGQTYEDKVMRRREAEGLERFREGVGALADRVNTKVEVFFRERYTSKFIDKAKLFGVDISHLQHKIDRLGTRIEMINRDLSDPLSTDVNILLRLHHNLSKALDCIDRISTELTYLKNETSLRKRVARKHHNKAVTVASYGIAAIASSSSSSGSSGSRNSPPSSASR